MSSISAFDGTVRLFISYSHVDEKWLGFLRPLIKGFSYDPRVNVPGSALKAVHAWSDGELPKGSSFNKEIENELNTMDIFVPLVSYDFLGSDYIQKIELPAAKSRHEKDGIIIVPIHLIEVDLEQKYPFLAGFTPLPVYKKPWSKFSPRNAAHKLIDNGLWEAIASVIKRRTP